MRRLMLALVLVFPVTLGDGIYFVASGKDCKLCDARTKECCPPIRGSECQKKCPRATGAVLPLSGPLASVGTGIRSAMELAVEQINAAGGIEGANLILLLRDDEGKPNVAAKQAENLVQMGVLAVIDGATSASALSMAKVLNGKGVPYVVAGAAADAITQSGYEWVFRTGPSVSLAWAPLTSFLEGPAKDIKSLNIVVAQTWSSTAEILVGWAKGRGVATDVYNIRATVDPREMGTRLISGRPDAIVVAGPTEHVVLVIKNLRTAGPTGYRPKMVAVLDLGALDWGRIRNEVGDGLESIFVTGVRAEFPAGKEFKDVFRAKFGRLPDARETMAYSAVWVTTEGVRRGVREALNESKPLTHENVRRGLATSGTQTPFGLVNFKTFGNFMNQTPSIENGQVVLLQWQKAVLQRVWPTSFRESDPVYPARLQ